MQPSALRAAPVRGKEFVNATDVSRDDIDRDRGVSLSSIRPIVYLEFVIRGPSALSRSPETIPLSSRAAREPKDLHGIGARLDKW